MGCNVSPSAYYQAKIPDIWGESHLSDMNYWDQSKAKTMGSLLKTIRYFIFLSETEYNDRCQYDYNVLNMLANYTVYTRLLFKISFSVKLLYILLIYREYRDTHMA